MEVLTKTEAELRIKEIVKRIKAGIIFIHPTDTIYGLGCNALDQKAVKKLRELKARPHEPLSIWVPSVNWIKKNCDTKKAKEWLDKLPGPYTIIIPLKNKTTVAKNVAPGLKAIGVRYPEHWFGKIVQKLRIPIITTSANKAGQPFMTSLGNLDPEIAAGVEFMIDEGEKKARPSKLINLIKDEIKER